MNPVKQKIKSILLSLLLLIAAPAMSSFYFYHGDHLGSANWITDQKGVPIQYIHYAPYGELIDNQRAIGYNERYKFTGKERDWESGYDYFGARFYWSPGGHWLSVDPLVDKYLWITPYAYCAWNPVRFVDQDGRKIVVGSWCGRALAMLGVNNFEAKTQNRLQSLKTISKELNEAITDLESNSNVIIQIFPTSQFQKDYPIEAAQNDSWKKGVTKKNDSNSTIYYQADKGFLVDGNYSSADAILAHEIGHAENNMNGTSVKYNRKEAKKSNGSIIEKRKGNLNEEKSIFYENQVRQQEGEPERSYDYYKANKDQ